MTVSYFVRYHGVAENADAFLAHYREVHVPHLLRFPGIRAVILHHAAESADPFPTDPGGDLLLAQMVFETVGDLDRALASPARADARSDFGSFPPFHGAVTHQAMIAEEFRP